MLLELIRNEVAIYSPHTAFDNTANGINDQIAARLGLSGVKPLRPSPGLSACKIVVFVPQDDLERVSEAMFAVGAGRIGQYSDCSFRLCGTGTFFGGEATRPAVGRKGRREEVEEVRLEVVCPCSAIDKVVAAMRSAHSYEEPAYDVYPLQATASSPGEGRIGRLSEPQTLGSFVGLVRDALAVMQVPVVGELNRPVQSVAIVCGSGGEYLTDAAQAGADVFLTGEMRFHDCLKAQALGIAAVLAGHYATERFAVEMLANKLKTRWSECSVTASRRETDPLSWLP
jgi:dinuclear metal center YbgI/SA1388 family protein